MATARLPQKQLTCYCASARPVLVPLVRSLAAQLSALGFWHLWPKISLVWPAKLHNSLSTFVATGSTMDGVTNHHSARCPFAFKVRLPRRLQFRATPRPSAAPVLSKAPSTREAPGNAVTCNTNSKSQQRFKSVACSAVAPPSAAAAAPAQVDNIPRGETAGANLILENATVQAGHRDLLEVSRTQNVLPQQWCIQLQNIKSNDDCTAHSAFSPVKAWDISATACSVQQQ